MAKRDKRDKRDKKGSKSRFKYQKRSKEDVKAAANQTAGNFDSYIKDRFKVYRPRDGKNHIRILPPTWDDARHYAFKVFVNFGIGVDNQSYLSLHKMKGEPDPLHEAMMEAKRDKDEKLAKALEAKQRSVLFIIDRMDEDAGPQIWPAPWTVDRDIANLCYDEDDGSVIMIDHPDEGCDVRFYKEGKGRNTTYNPSKMKILKPSPLTDDDEQYDEWLAFISENPIPECLQYYSYEHIESAFGGSARVDDDDDDDDRKGKKGRKGKANRHRDDDDDDDDRRRKSSKSKKSRRDDDDDDEDDDEDDEDEDDDDEDDDEDDRRGRKSSKSKSKSSKRRRDDDDDDDDDDEDDDDDDEDDDEDDEDEDDDDDEDDRRSKKSSKSKSSKGDKGKSRADKIKERLKKRKRD